MAKKYNESDLSFYTEIIAPNVRVDITNKGRVISWNPVDDVEGYAIYKGNGRVRRVKEQRFIKIVVISTHNHVHNKDDYYPTKKNVAVSEIEVYVVGSKNQDITDTLPESSFKASSSLDTNSGPKEAFNNHLPTATNKGWQSEPLKPNPYNQDSLYEWIQIDLGSPMIIDRLRIQNATDTIGLCGIYQYRIDTSVDGLYWTPLHQGTLDRENKFQEISLFDYFYKNKDAEDDWQLIETVGETTNYYLDGENLDIPADYRVTGIVVGDISFEGTATGAVDLKLTSDYESVRQDITNRVRSQKGQWKRHKNLGSNLELLEGMKNTRETANYGTELIENSLLFDGRIAPNDLKVRAVPKSVTQVDYYIIATSQSANEPIVVIENMEM